MKRLILILFVCFSLLSNCQNKLLLFGTPADITTDFGFWLSLDETSGSTAYDCGDLYDFTNTGITVNSTGKVGTSYYFDNNSDKLERTALDLTSPVTLSFWVNIGESSVSQSPIGIYTNMSDVYSGIEIGVGANYLRLRLGDSNGYSSSNYKIFYYDNYITSYETWYHISVVVNSITDFKVYVNGQLKSYSASSGSATNLSYDETGTFSVLGNSDSQIRLDELSYYNRALSAIDISYLYNSGNGRGCPF